MTATKVHTPLNDEQLEAVEASGEVFVSAGAGTGKTSVLVERFVRAVCERGIDVDSILVITYTRKAAGELRSRIRAALLERERFDLARNLDGAWISTIHGFCNRLLKAHPFAVGLDPRFRELDDPGAAVLRGEAFERALTAFCAGGDEDRLRLLSTYGGASLHRMLTGVYETLRSSGRDLLLELGARQSVEEAVLALRTEAECLAADTDATATQRGNALEALLIATPETLPERLIDLGAVACRSSARAASYESARKALERAALEDLAARDRDLLQILLELFAAEYAEAKRRESAVDFEDLQLAARDLLRADDEVRETESMRFRLLMVDEFQDTNRLQCEIVDLLSRDDTERFFVGDEFQSIYGFRHADVAVFRERREGTDDPVALRKNYRSRPEVLAAINHLFGDEFGDAFQPLMASGVFADPVLGHPVELLVTDKSSYRGTGEHWRRGEARHVARRLKELVHSGAATPGEIVVLFAAGTDAEWYEEELRREGLPTYRATGRRYFGQQQVNDLLAYLRLLHNRYDDVALATVLASPFVGISNDTLVQLRRHAGRRPLFAGLERSLPPGLGADDVRLLQAFRQRFERLVVVSERTGLEHLCEQILVAHDYDLAVLARWDGRRRYANLRKLARLARAYEALRGRDLEGFVRFVRDQGALGAGELEAVAEEEGADAVRLLTIHAAKGLEFKVVCVADAGRDTAGFADPDEIVALSDGRFGFKAVHPTRGNRTPVFGYEEVERASREQERSERLRLYYVAMTRAVDRLIVSGAVDPEREADRQTPLGWALNRLDAETVVSESSGQPIELDRGSARFLLRVDRHLPAAGDDHAVEEADRQLALFGEWPLGSPRPGFVLPELTPLPTVAAHSPRRLSYSAVALFERCGYRYWAERVAGMRATDSRSPRHDTGHEGLLATEIGDAVHRLLEQISLADPRPPESLRDLVLSWYPTATGDELARIAELVDAYCASPLAQRLTGLVGAAPEIPFAFEHDGVLLHGRLDVLWRDANRALVVDYKSNQLGDASPAEIVDADYRLQRAVYALACLNAGASEVEVVYQFLERPDDVVSSTFTATDAPVLADVLSEAIARIRQGEFRPTPSAFACQGCPALDVVCAGPRLGLLDYAKAG